MRSELFTCAFCFGGQVLLDDPGEYLFSFDHRNKAVLFSHTLVAYREERFGDRPLRIAIHGGDGNQEQRKAIEDDVRRVCECGPPGEVVVSSDVLDSAQLDAELPKTQFGDTLSLIPIDTQSYPLPTTVGFHAFMLRAMRHDSASECAIIALATEWQSRHGGLSTFNRLMCRAFRAIGCPVTCYISGPVSLEDRNDAKGITLISETDSVASAAAVEATNHLRNRRTIIIGHDTQTAERCAEHRAFCTNTASTTVYVGHVSSNDETYKTGARRKRDRDIHAKRKLRAKLCQGVDVMVAVGPRVKEDLDDIKASFNLRARVVEIVPGIHGEISKRSVPSDGRLKIMLAGRAEDIALKGFDIGYAAVAIAREHQRNASRKDQIQLMIRGASEDERLRKTVINAAKRLRSFEEIPTASVHIHPYDSDPNELTSDFRGAAVFLMPSRAEGFGLVALEALATGTPILISSNTGLARVLKTISGGDRFVVKGKNESDVDAWVGHINEILDNLDSYFDLAVRVACAYQEKYSWGGVAEVIRAACSG